MSPSRQVCRCLDDEHRAQLERLDRVEQAIARAADTDLATLAGTVLRHLEQEIERHFGFEETQFVPLMARSDHGDFGHTEPVAVIDTLGVDPEYARRGIGRALLSQPFANLGALRVERVETMVPRRDLRLLGFLHQAGFASSQRLPFVRHLGSAR